VPPDLVANHCSSQLDGGATRDPVPPAQFGRRDRVQADEVEYGAISEVRRWLTRGLRPLGE